MNTGAWTSLGQESWDHENPPTQVPYLVELQLIALDTSCCERTFSLMNRLSRFQRSKLGLAMLSTLVTIIELGRATGWTDIAKIPVDAIIERWMAKGCEKGQSRRLQKLFADGHVVDAEMEQAAGVTVSDVRVAT